MDLYFLPFADQFFINLSEKLEAQSGLNEKTVLLLLNVI